MEFWLKPVEGNLRKELGNHAWGTCAHEGELVAMKGNTVEFWLKPVGSTRKRLEATKGGTCAHEG